MRAIEYPEPKSEPCADPPRADAPDDFVPLPRRPATVTDTDAKKSLACCRFSRAFFLPLLRELVARRSKSNQINRLAPAQVMLF
jgi:hypothetical protein